MMASLVAGRGKVYDDVAINKGIWYSTVCSSAIV
jgi:hypothetical protein